MSKASLVTVLAEGKRDQRFVYRYLTRLGYSNHDIFLETLPSGRGSGEQWVRENYARVVSVYRWRSARAKTAVVVVIDADTGEVAERLRQLRDGLAQANLEARREGEAIIHFIPKRNIETWILCLNGVDVDEVTNYRETHGIDEQIVSGVRAFFDGSRLNTMPPNKWVPSLVAAIPEVRRLD